GIIYWTGLRSCVYVHIHPYTESMIEASQIEFGETCRLDGSYFLCRHDHIKKLANMLEKVPVSMAMSMPKGSARNDAELLDHETKYQVVEEMATYIADLLCQSFIKASWKPETRQEGKPRLQQKEDGHERRKGDGYKRLNPLVILDSFVSTSMKRILEQKDYEMIEKRVYK
ncbi:unnamed protein product, partial [Dovyalis caffra]